MIVRDLYLLVTLKASIMNSAMTLTFIRIALAFSIYAKLIIQILPLFRDEVPVKHSFTEIKKRRERKNICMYVYIYMKIYICTNAKVYIFNQENAIVNYYQRALSFT